MLQKDFAHLGEQHSRKVRRARATLMFMSERGVPMSAIGFRRMTTRLGKVAKMPFQIHPHMHGIRPDSRELAPEFWTGR
jgi:hypothetical protein